MPRHIAKLINTLRTYSRGDTSTASAMSTFQHAFSTQAKPWGRKVSTYPNEGGRKYQHGAVSFCQNPLRRFRLWMFALPCNADKLPKMNGMTKPQARPNSPVMVSVLTASLSNKKAERYSICCVHFVSLTWKHLTRLLIPPWSLSKVATALPKPQTPTRLAKKTPKGRLRPAGLRLNSSWRI